MAFFQYLNFDGADLPLPDSYEVDMADKEADSGGETEAGTVQRDVNCTGGYWHWFPRYSSPHRQIALSSKYLLVSSSEISKKTLSISMFNVFPKRLGLVNKETNGF